MADLAPPPEQEPAPPAGGSLLYTEPAPARLLGIPVIFWVLLGFVALMLVLALLGWLPTSVL
ncbi:MAG: hypothetical protein M3Z04_13795 [Chloroflexota bacterium]|nr:hypothetical protein [Chloroflexota bacterium]